MRFLRNALSFIWGGIAIVIFILSWGEWLDRFKNNFILTVIILFLFVLLPLVTAFAFSDIKEPWNDEYNVRNEPKKYVIFATILATITCFFCFAFSTSGNLWFSAKEVEKIKKEQYENGKKYAYSIADGTDNVSNDWKAGYLKRYQEALNNPNEEYNYIPPDEKVSTPPETAVFVTPSGSKYHTEYCRYVEERTDISYYNNSEEAEQEGYTPCSMCH